MSIRTGKRYEREVASLLRDRAWTVERVTGSGGFSGTRSADLIMLPPGINTGGERIDDWAANTEGGADRIICAEVKYSSSASGFRSLYYEHMARCGLGTTSSLWWTEDRAHTGGLSAWASRYRASGPWDEMPVEHAVRGAALPKTVLGFLGGERAKAAPDVVFLRGGSPLNLWLAIWRSPEQPG